MAKSKKASSKKSKAQEAKPLPKSLRKGRLPRPANEIWAAGIGALAQARSTTGQSFDALVALGGAVVEKGTGAARTAVGQVGQAADAVTGTARGVADGALGTVQGGVEAVVEAALGTLGVPGREEVLALKAQVEALQTRVAALREAESGRPDVGAPESGAPAAEPAAYEVVTHDRGWAVRRVGADRATAVHATKKDALRDARQTARAQSPSTLTIYKADGTVAETSEYAAG